MSLKMHKKTREGRLYIELIDGEAEDRAVDSLSALDLCEVMSPALLSDALSFYGVDLAPMLRGELGLLPTHEIASDGNNYGQQGGLNLTKDAKPAYTPFSARGAGNYSGLYETFWREEIQIRRPWSDALDQLIAGDWYVDAPDQERQEQASIIEAALNDISGGWDQFLTEAFSAPLNGFALFERVYNPKTFLIDKLAFRYPRQVRRWIKTADNRHLVAVELDTPHGAPALVPAHHLLLISWDAFGEDYEGNSALRPVAKYIVAKAMFDRLEALAGEKYGTPILAIKGAPAKDGSDEQLLRDILDHMRAEDLVVFSLPDGREIELISPTGVMPDFSPVKSYLDSKIAMALRGESNLIGQGQTGSYALAEVSDDKSTRAAPSYARRICNAINGSRGRPYQGVIRQMTDARWGRPADGRYCQLRFAQDRNARGNDWIPKVSQAKQAGLITWGARDEETVREHLGLASLEEVRG